MKIKHHENKEEPQALAMTHGPRCWARGNEGAVRRPGVQASPPRTSHMTLNKTLLHLGVLAREMEKRPKS